MSEAEHDCDTCKYGDTACEECQWPSYSRWEAGESEQIAALKTELFAAQQALFSQDRAAREQAEGMVKALGKYDCDAEEGSDCPSCGQHPTRCNAYVVHKALADYRKAIPKTATCACCSREFTITNETRRCPECAEKIVKVE